MRWLSVALVVGVSMSPADRVSAAPVDQNIVVAWGDNEHGQLGNGTYQPSADPVSVGLPGNVVQVASGGKHNLALLEDGSVYAWGLNQCGRLGNGSNAPNNNKPARVPLGPAKRVAAGYFHSIALLRDGTVWTWGCGNYGQLGTGTKYDHYSPVRVPGLGGVTSIAGGATFTLAVRGGDVFGWGNNEDGQLGQLPLSADYLHPRNVPGLHGIIEVAAQYSGAMALRGNTAPDPYSVWTWGDNRHGELGDPAYTQKVRVKPLVVPGLAPMDVSSISAGFQHRLAMVAGAASDSKVPPGSVWAWGDGTRGQRGDGTCTSIQRDPVQVPNLPPVAQISGGEEHTVALGTDGLVYAWGGNGFKQLGYPTTSTCTSTPGQVPGLSGVLGVTAGDRHTIAIVRAVR